MRKTFVSLCILLNVVPASADTTIDVNTKIKYNINVVDEAFNNSGFAYYAINEPYHDTKIKIREELNKLLQPTYSIGGAVKLCTQISAKHFSGRTNIDKEKYIAGPCKKFGEELVKQHNIVAEQRKKYEGWTVAKIKSAIKPGTRVKGAEYTDYYIAENNANPQEIASCFSPCVFQKSTNKVICCFDMCGDGINIFSNNQCKSTGCETASNPNFFIYEWCGNTNKLNVVDKKSSKAAQYDFYTDFERELNYKLDNMNELYRILEQ